MRLLVRSSGDMTPMSRCLRGSSVDVERSIAREHLTFCSDTALMDLGFCGVSPPTSLALEALHKNRSQADEALIAATEHIATQLHRKIHGNGDNIIYLAEQRRAMHVGA
eukprot:g22158.t1